MGGLVDIVEVGYPGARAVTMGAGFGGIAGIGDVVVSGGVKFTEYPAEYDNGMYCCSPLLRSLGFGLVTGEELCPPSHRLSPGTSYEFVGGSKV